MFVLHVFEYAASPASPSNRLHLSKDAGCSVSITRSCLLHSCLIASSSLKVSANDGCENPLVEAMLVICWPGMINKVAEYPNKPLILVSTYKVLNQQ